MKIISAIILVMMIITSFSTMILAENETVDAEATTTSIDDDSEDLGLDEEVSEGKIFRRKFAIWFTFNQEKRAEKELDLARLRLIQAKIAAKNNNTEAMEKALEAHERILEKIQVRAEKLEEKNVSKLTGLQRAIEVHDRRIIKISEVLEGRNLTEEQRTRLESRLEKTELVSGKLTTLSEKIRIRERTMDGETESEDESDEEEEEEDSEDDTSSVQAQAGQSA